MVFRYFLVVSETLHSNKLKQLCQILVILSGLRRNNRSLEERKWCTTKERKGKSMPAQHGDITLGLIGGGRKYTRATGGTGAWKRENGAPPKSEGEVNAGTAWRYHPRTYWRREEVYQGYRWNRSLEERKWCTTKEQRGSQCRHSMEISP